MVPLCESKLSVPGKLSAWGVYIKVTWNCEMKLFSMMNFMYIGVLGYVIHRCTELCDSG